MSHFVKEMKKRQKEEERLDKSSSKKHRYYETYKELSEIIDVTLQLTGECTVRRAQNIIHIEGDLMDNISNSYTPHSYAYYFGLLNIRKRILITRFKRNSLSIEFNFDLSDDCKKCIQSFMSDNIYIKNNFNTTIFIKNMKHSINNGTLSELICALVENMSVDKLKVS